VTQVGDSAVKVVQCNGVGGPARPVGRDLSDRPPAVVIRPVLEGGMQGGDILKMVGPGDSDLLGGPGDSRCGRLRGGQPGLRLVVAGTVLAGSMALNALLPSKTPEAQRQDTSYSWNPHTTQVEARASR